MRVVIRLAVAVVGVVALIAVSAGCGTSAGGGSGWKEIAAAEISGKEPVRLSLGTHKLGGSVRLDFAPSGPTDPQVRLAFVIVNVANGSDFGTTVSPQTDPDVFDKDKALTLSPISPGVYRVFFAQRFAAADGPGYDMKLTLSTRK
jgi:hypothetical protein